jgi:uncharacterized membrane protein YfcA
VRRRLALVGAVAGLLSGLLGIGGGIIIVPGLMWAAGCDRHTASGTSLVAILPIAVVAALTYAVAPGGACCCSRFPTVIVGALTHRHQGTLAPRTGLTVGFAGMALAIPGALLAFALPVSLLRVMFGVFLIAGCIRTLQSLRASRPAPIQ